MGIRVRTIGAGAGPSADLTDQVVGLSWSSVNPGGDERCTFSLKRQWFSGAPEIQQGNIVCVTDGLACLWTGRIEENDRAVQDSELIGVTAYGLGIRLKDDQSFMQVYVDRDPAKWGQMPYNRAVTYAGTIDFSTLQWQSEAGGLVCPLPNYSTGTLNAQVIAETWYTAPNGVTIGKFMYVGTDTGLPASWEAPAYFRASSDSATVGSQAITLDSTLRSLTPTTALRYGMLREYSNGTASNPAVGANRRFAAIAVYGNHGLTTRSIDASTPDGVYGGDVVSNLISGVTGITAARIDAPTTVLPHLVFDTPTTREDAIRFTNQYFGYDWGTFGASSVLDTSTTGYFYWQAKDSATAHWFARRADCDDVSLQVELATLYNQVLVTYQDPTTTGLQTVTRTATVQALSDAGLTRTARIDGGVLTAAGAQTLGDAFLALTGQQAPARGSVTFSGKLTHYQRGVLPCHFLRADGSNLRLPDVLPSKDALSLSTQPDRRTTFPVTRVEIDCSGDTPKATVEVDQSNDRLSVLQARLSLAAQFPNGLPGSSFVNFPNRNR